MAATRAAQLRFILSELALAISFCRSASLLSGAPVLRMLLHAREALLHSAQFLKAFQGSDRERKQLAAETQILRAALQQARSASTFRGWMAPDWPDQLAHSVS